ncbi:7-carboxy-7-deazaguanine synthase QueE [bacterium]|nr:7-carboxy-7-deazaguanine synthase QueE [bacterium]
MNKIKIKEIFTSIQGEGPYIGYNQLFIRFCNCNLKCNFCDTKFSSNENVMEFCPNELADYINKNYDMKKVHSISLTGGEPLLSTAFLREFLPLVPAKKYLETNATLADKLLEIKPFIDYICADIKLESATGIKDTYKFHDKFFEKCKGVETFAKIVFDENITNEEIEICANLGKKYDIELILQPVMKNDKMSVSSKFIMEIYDKFLSLYPKVRVIPQVHKFIGVE